MSALAEAWACDASNVTWLVDRLEEHGLVVRQAVDHRPAGQDRGADPARHRGPRPLRAAFTDPPPDLDGLELADLEALCVVLRKTGVSAHQFEHLIAAWATTPGPPRLRTGSAARRLHASGLMLGACAPTAMVLGAAAPAGLTSGRLGETARRQLFARLQTPHDSPPTGISSR